MSWNIRDDDITLDVPHDKVDGEDYRDADEGDDEHEDEKVPLEPNVLDGVYPALPEDHVIFQCEDTHHPGTHPAVNFRELATNYRVRVILQITNKSSWR